MIKCDVSGLRNFRDCLGSMSAGQLMMDCAQELADKLVEAAQSRTPVDTGRLKDGFVSAEIMVSGDMVTANLTNDVEYASFVELGHQTPKGAGWVAGRFMLTMAASDIEAMAPEILLGSISEFLEGCVSGGK